VQGAGGIGGLLITESTDAASLGTWFPTYDGNGNISEYLAANGTTVAHLEYDPFGNLLPSISGEAPFAHRFNTKPQDAVTGLYYYGYRDYEPVNAQWPSRDPIFDIISEPPEFLSDGSNLHAFVGNSPVNWFDYLGLATKKACKEAYKLAFKGANGIDPNNQWAAFTTNVFGSKDWDRGIKAAMKYFDTDNNGKLDNKDNPPFKIRVVGYSWGGWSAIRFAQKIGDKVDNPEENLRMAVGTLDPVGTLRPGNANLPAWVRSGTNIYQTNGCYRGCPGAGRWYAGTSVTGAENTDLSDVTHGDPRYKDPKELNYDHITIQTKAADIVRAVNRAKLD